jgi:CubicO group peptidase (beta-lactamase class C family)
VGELKELLEAARRDVDTGWLPACQLAVAKDGELVAFETYGDAADTTRFCMFSAVKPVVASAVWLLVGDRRLDVAAPLAEYVPELAHLVGVTVEHVLLHTCGFPNAPMPAEEGVDPERRRRRFASWRLEWEPGSRFDYHPGSAHWVLADLLERLDDRARHFHDVVDQAVCAPLGLPRLLGVADGVAPLSWLGGGEPDLLYAYDDPAVLAAGPPGSGGVATAATMARFYQALLHNPGGLWDGAVLTDAKTNIRCRFPDALRGVAVNRTIGLVLAGDDGRHIERQGAFGQGCSPLAFGHAGAHLQVAWADPATGISFAYFTNGLDADLTREGVRAYTLSSLAADLTL